MPATVATPADVSERSLDTATETNPVPSDTSTLPELPDEVIPVPPFATGSVPDTSALSDTAVAGDCTTPLITCTTPVPVTLGIVVWTCVGVPSPK